jgi:hypothetical protein
MRLLQLVDLTRMGGIETYGRSLFSAINARDHDSILVSAMAETLDLRCPTRPFHVVRRRGTDGQSRDRAVAQVAAIVHRARSDIALVHTAIGPVVAEWLVRELPTVYLAYEYGALCRRGALLFERTDSIYGLLEVPDVRCIANSYVQRCNTRRPWRLWASCERERRRKEWVRRRDTTISGSAFVAHWHVAAGFPVERVIALHNETYVLLKHAGWPGKLDFRLYMFAIGDWTAVGIARVPWLLWQSGWRPEPVRTNVAGKLRGLHVYLAGLRNRAPSLP